MTRSGELPVVKLGARRNSLHPWIFQKMVDRPRQVLPPGTWVTIVEKGGVFAGRGIYNPRSPLALRVITELESDRIDYAFFQKKLRSAKDLRESVLSIPGQSDSYRLVHSEADGLSGLIIDKYADLLIIEPISAGYVRIMDDVIAILRDLYPGCRVAVRPDDKQAEKEGVRRECEDLRRNHPAPESVTIRENSIQMVIRFATGHKTGYFLDQRDNRRSIAQLSAGKSVLDLFCYTGGFAISAARAGAREVTGVDLDEKSLDTAKQNARLNRVSPDWIQRNVFDELRQRVEEKRRSDVVIVDPSKLAGVRDEISRAKRTYGDLNRLAMKVMNPGGILMTSSCSGLISEPDYLSILTRSAAEAGVVFQAFRITGASGDHPFLSNFPESRYLKVVFARIWPATAKRILSEERRERTSSRTDPPATPEKGAD